MGLDVVIFAFNRADHLRNAVDSVLRHVPAGQVLIMDDWSTDRRTVALLESFSHPRISVVRPDTMTVAGKRGGLRANMSDVWERHLTGDLALYMQDDMQIVRTLDDIDLQWLTRFAADASLPPFLDVIFADSVVDSARLRGGGAGPDDSESLQSSYDADRAVFVDSRAVGCIDTGVWAVRRAKELCWYFTDSEQDDWRRAFDLLGPMRSTAFPFLAFTPRPMSYRDRGLSLTRRLYFRLRGGFFPIDDMSSVDVRALRENAGIRPSTTLYLRSSSFGRPPPWPALPMSDAPPWVARLDAFEQRSRARLRCIRSTISSAAPGTTA